MEMKGTGMDSSTQCGSFSTHDNLALLAKGSSVRVSGQDDEEVRWGGRGRGEKAGGRACRQASQRSPSLVLWAKSQHFPSVTEARV